MFKMLATSSLVALLFCAGQANAALVVDTGAPTAQTDLTVGLSLDGYDYFGGQVTFAQNSTINSINAYLNLASSGGMPSGDTFTVALYGDNGNKVGGLINAYTASYTDTGWNGVSALNQQVSAGKYWIAFEGDSSGSTFVAPTVQHPLALTAFSDGSGLGAYKNAAGMNFGVQVDAVAAVPEPGNAALMLAGLGLMGYVVRRRQGNNT